MNTLINRYLIICFLLLTHEVAGDTLRVVMPFRYSNGTKKMLLKWDPTTNAQAYGIRMKIGNGAWGAFDSIGVKTSDTITYAFDNTSTYYFQIRAKVGGSWQSPPDSLGNSFKTNVWPVASSNGNCNTESVEILHGFGQPLEIGKNYLHEGVDIRGPINIASECVKAPQGAMVWWMALPPNTTDMNVDIEMFNNSAFRYIQFNHLNNIDAAVFTNGSVQPGQKLGEIDPRPGVWTTMMTHTHMHYYTGKNHSNQLNPFSYWDTTKYRDPQNKMPSIRNTNGGDDSIRFRKGPNTVDYFDKDTVHNAVDVVAECTDWQSTGAPFHVAKSISYFIQKQENSAWNNVVKTPGAPYVFLDNINDFGNGYGGMNPHMNKLLDTTVAVATPPANYTWSHRFTFIITNTNGTTGTAANLGTNECFATDARNSVGTDNGYTNNYDKARCIEEAKFPDNRYRIGIILTDFLNTAPTHFREFTVDNFRPYAKKVVMKTDGANIYSADWAWNSGSDKLTLNKNTLPAKARCDKPLEIIIDMSEPMTNVSLFIPVLGYSETLTDAVANTDKKQFKFTIPAEKVAKGGKFSPITIVIMGKDIAGNEVMGFNSENDVAGASIHKRKLDGTWLPATPPLPDNIHKFKVDSVHLEMEVKDATCEGKSDGEIKLTVTGGETPYTYQWSNNSTSKDLTGVPKGNYLVKVKDKNKCEAEKSETVDNKLKVEVSVSGGGSFTRPCDRVLEITMSASASGGEAPYTYNWPDGILKLYHSGPSPKFGFYTANATDKNGCKGKRTAYVFSVPILCSYDPNDIIGPPGFGDQKFVARSAVQPYKIRFENDPDFATAPASRVTVDLPMDANMDMNTFKLGSFGFNNWTFTVPANLSTYSTRLDLRDTLGIFVDVTAGINQSAKKAFWIFESIDPNTGLPPTSGLLGFLPVNDTSIKNGEGFVDFTIKAKSNTNTGDSLRAKAVIVFDNNPAIYTPRIHNIIDAVAPVSSPDAMPSTIDSATFVIHLNAVDDNGGSGVGGIDLMVSENGGAYKAYEKNITDSFVIFTGNPGAQYRFYTQAADNVENREAAKSNPEITITITPKDFLKAIDSGFTICSGDTMNIEWKRVAISAFILQMSANNGPFVTLATGLSGVDTIYKWVLKDTFKQTAIVKLRAISGSTGSVLDSTRNFTVNPSPAVKLGNDTFFCDGSSISLVLDAGAGYSSYLWNNNSSNQTLSVNSEGLYFVFTGNSFGCTATDSVIVSKAPRPQINSKTVSNVACFGNTNGSISISTSSGTLPYKYLWNTADTTEDLSGLTAGNYILTITDAKGCFVKDSSVITSPSQLISSGVITNVKCKNGNDGSINLSISGGNSPYSFAWNNSSTNEDQSTITAGTYTVSITDASNCNIKDTFVITEPDLLTSSVSTLNVNCKNGNDGSADLSVAGGVSPYTYAWSNSATSQDINILTAGTYTVIVTDANLCIVRDTAIITEPPLLTGSYSAVNVKCKNGNDGSINMSINGGVAPYTFAWSNSASSEDLSNLSAGVYTVTVTDANNCIIRDTITITEPSLLTLSKTSENVKCKNGNDGSIDISISGGTTPYTYLWNNAATTQDIGTLSAGTYSLIVTDGNNCTVRDTTVITEPPLLTRSKVVLNVKCKNGNDGSIDISVSGGVTPYTYAWSNSASTQDISSLIAGTYTLLITDANACLLRDTSIVTEPALLVNSGSVQHVKCKNGNDGSINLSVSGGTTPYSFVWSNSASSEDLSGLSAGTYSVLITDANLCTRRDTFTITEPALLTRNHTLTHVKCKNGNNGAIDLNVNGGTTPYTYLWSNSATTQDLSNLTAGTYTVTITDANNCIVRDTGIITEPTLLTRSKSVLNVKCKNGNDGSIDISVGGGVTPYTYLWSNSATTQDIASLTAGTYILVITDANACVLRDTSIITEPALLSSSKTISHVKCKNGNDGSINLSVSGGTTPYSFVWSNSASTEDISGLTAGIYTVLITDANGCIRRDTVTVTEPAILAKTKTFQHVKCKNGNDGSIDISISGGTSPYTYLWSNNATTQDISSLVAGTYHVRVTDANGCIIRDTTSITEPTLLTRSKSSLNVKCKNGNDGSIDLSVSGGVTPYTYLWSNNATTQDIGSLSAGTYHVRITDNNGCILRDTTVITEPALLTRTRVVQNVSCKNGNNGSINLSISGGTTPYTFLWSNSAVSEDLSGLTAGTYTVVITDANACVLRDTVQITEPALLTSSGTFATVKCKNGNDGNIDLSVNGGTTPYNFLWSNGAVSEDISNLSANTYTVIVRDALNCIVRDTFTITEPALLIASHTLQNVKCKNGNSGSIDLSISGGVTPYVYLWSNLATAQDLNNLIVGTYTVRVTDANACVVRDTVVITEPTLLTSGISISDVLCHAGSDGSASVNGIGGTSPYIYNWSSGENTAGITGKIKGTYIVTITDQNLCFRKDTINISEPQAPLSLTKTVTDVNCYAGTDGSIDISIAGGTTPYTYLWSNSKTSEDLSNEAKGKYSLIVTDKNACVLLDTTDISEPLAPLSRTMQITDVKCFAGNDGALDLGISGGTAPYTYLWSNGANTEDIGTLISGKYSVTVTDANNCVLKDSADVSQPAAPLSSVLSESNINCFGGNDGSVDASINGGTLPYIFSWSNGANTEDLSNVVQGKYVLIVTDKNNCTHKDSITLTQPSAPLTATLTGDDVDCFGDNTGAVDLSASGGTPSYTFNWNNGASTEDISGLIKGWYIVTVSDINNCTFTDSVFVDEPSELQINAFAISATKSANNGTAWVQSSGGTPPYVIQWNDPSAQTEDTAVSLKTGPYIVTVTDNKGCFKTDTVEVPNAPDPSTIGLFPNPSNGSVTIFNLASLGLDETIIIELFDLSGKMFMDFEVKGKDIHTFDLYDSFANGTYIVRIRNSRGLENRRLIVIR